MPFDDSLTLAYNDPLVGRNLLEGFRGALRPAYGDVHLGEWAQAKMNAKVTLRHEISAAAHFIDLLAVAGRHGDSRADRVAAGCGQRPYQQSITSGAEVFEQRRRLKKVDDHNLFGSIVVEVSHGNSARGVPGGNAGAGDGRHIEELPVSAIPKKLARLAELLAKAMLFNEGIDVSGRYKKILPAVVVDVNKGRTPFYVAGLHR